MTVDGISAADHEATLKTNLDGAIDITLALLLHLAQGARVVQVASRESRLRASNACLIFPGSQPILLVRSEHHWEARLLRLSWEPRMREVGRATRLVAV
jgi:NAD(P)-dependent dehydrogenase (short-subunit alcohol dehydrogenase family)